VFITVYGKLGNRE